ncbi:MAG: M23 family metallopeptidase [Proteobacteria bacterium]|nr:M23 family metallopeptidase [Pseudomonadota bacterium]
MASKKNVIPALIFVACLVLILPAHGAGIQVTWDSDAVVPGSIVMVSVTTAQDLAACEAVVGPDRFPLVKVKDDRYVALVGIDLGEKKEIIPVDLDLFPFGEETPYRLRADLEVRQTGEKPPVQNLSLPTGMVEFSPERLKRIRKDNAELGKSLAARTRARFWDEGFLLPVPGRISAEFGVRRVLNGQERAPHSGVDIAANQGTPIQASNHGVVVLAEDLYLMGKTVVLDHGWGVNTLYGHLEGISVSEGEEVNRGNTIGTVGATGRATGPHLHFGAYIRGIKVDPLKLIEATREFSSSGQVP